MSDGFVKRFSQPGEAATRYYLARLGWVGPEDTGPAEPTETAEAPASPERARLTGWGTAPAS